MIIILSYIHFVVNQLYLIFVHDVIQTSCFFLGGKEADFSEQCSRRVLSVGGAYCNPWVPILTIEG